MKAKNLFLMTMALTLSASWSACAESDALPTESLKFQSTNPEESLDALMKSPGAIFQKYVPDVPEDMQLTSKLQVSGSETSQPVIKMSLCQRLGPLCFPSLGMIGKIKIKSTNSGQGSCNKKYLMTMDLGNSHPLISKTYSAVNVRICYVKGANQQDTLRFETSVEQGTAYVAAPPQMVSAILEFLKMQIPKITRATVATLQAYSPNQVKEQQSEVNDSENVAGSPAN